MPVQREQGLISQWGPRQDQDSSKSSWKARKFATRKARTLRTSASTDSACGWAVSHLPLLHPCLTRCSPRANKRLQKLKNDMRQEISTQTRLAAVEAKGSGGVVVQQTTVQAPPPPAYAAPVYVGRERYCGPISLIIGIFLFP